MLEAFINLSPDCIICQLLFPTSLAQGVPPRVSQAACGSGSRYRVPWAISAATREPHVSEHWIKLKINNPLERIMREIRRRTRVVGAFPDGQSTLNLAAARLRHIAGTRWSSTKRYMNMDLIKRQRT